MKVIPVAERLPRRYSSAMAQGRQFWIAWLLACGIGYALTEVVGVVVGRLTAGWSPLEMIAWVRNPVVSAAIAGAQGAMIGAAQWLVLRRMIRHAGWWILVTGLSWGIARLISLDI